MLRNSLDPDPDSDFRLDPESMNMDPKPCPKVTVVVRSSLLFQVRYL